MSDEPASGQAPAESQDTAPPEQAPASEAAQGEQAGEPRTFDESYVKKLRDEAAKYRTEKKDTEQKLSQYETTLEQLRKALDPDASQEEDPAEVAERATAERDAKDQELRELRLERAADKAARTHGADVTALTDSKSFAKAADELDPTAADFDEQMSTLVEQAVIDNPKLRASQTPARSSSAITGGTGGKPTFTSSQIASMSPQDYAANEDAILQALADGRVS